MQDKNDVNDQRRQMARRELARRELERRASERSQQEQQSQQQPFYSRYPRDIAAGLLEGGRGLLNFPHNIGLSSAPYIEPKDFRKTVGLTGEAGLADKLLMGLGEFAPALAMPELGLGKLGGALEKIPAIGKYLKSIVGNAIPQGLYSATQSGDDPLKGGLEAGAISAPYSALSTALSSGSPLARTLARAGLSGLGAGTGYIAGKTLGLSPVQTSGLAAAGLGAGLIGRNPEGAMLNKISEGVKDTNYIQKLEAAKRLGLSYLTPAEASANPFLAGIQGATGKSEQGAKQLYKSGLGRIEEEKKAIDKLHETIFPKEMEPEVSSLYKESGNKIVPEDTLTSLKDNEVFKRAERMVQNKPAYREDLKGVDPNSIEYLNQIKRAMGDMIEKAPKSEARIIKSAQKDLLSKMDTISPEYQKARQLSERAITKDKLLEKLNDYETKGTTFFNSVLKNDNKYNKLLHSLRNVPEAQSQLKDMRLIFRDLINPPTPRTAAGFTKAGMNQARNTKQAYSDMLREVFSSGKNDKNMVDLITNPKWSEELKNINKMTNFEKKLKSTMNLLGKINAAGITSKNKPLELELNTGARYGTE